MKTVILQPGKETSLRRRHPWVFAGAVAAVEGDPVSGETVEIRSSGGGWLGRGAYSPHSQIRVRVWTFIEPEAVGPEFFRDRLRRAGELCPLRRQSAPGHSCRLVNGEADGLPGLIVDRYGEFIVCQFLAAGTEFWKETIADELERLGAWTGIYERSDGNVRKKEGLAKRAGTLRGETPPDRVEIREEVGRFLVDLKNGQKTGFYLDQRESRAALAEYAPTAQTLNCFSYTGGFAVAALGAGAKSAVNIDSSAEALELATRNLALNGIEAGRSENVRGSVSEVLRLYRDSRRRFDLIVLDPPKFAEFRRQLEKAGRAYKDINLLAFKLLNPGGVLFTFSCSGHVGKDLFRKIVAWAALDAGRNVRVVRRLGPPPDHPEALNFPEGSYLKGLVCVV